MVRQPGFEPGTYGLEGRCSIQLSYWRIGLAASQLPPHYSRLPETGKDRYSSGILQRPCGNHSYVVSFVRIYRPDSGDTRMNITPESVLVPRPLEYQTNNGAQICIDRETPNWFAIENQGGLILNRFDGIRSFGEVVNWYTSATGFEFAKAWQHVETLTRDAVRQRVLHENTPNEDSYQGRLEYIGDSLLSELWIHTNNSCNLACRHCLVSSGPDGDRGLPVEDLLSVIDQARSLGTKRFYFTGGEPFIRKDLFELIDGVLSDPEAELAILTNGIPIKGRTLAELQKRDRERFRLQISLDGSISEINDPIRGDGSFPKIIEGIANAVQSGLSVTVTTTITSTNADDVPAVTRLIAGLGAGNHHLLWLHKRGRAGGKQPVDTTPPVEKVIEVVREARRVANEVGVIIDNHEATKSRLRSPIGVKRDLSGACVSSLCVYSDGKVYPSAAMANIENLLIGNVLERPLKEIWRESPIAKEFRETTVENKEICPTCPLKFICGGGDLEHSYFYGESIQAHDPYCELHKAMFRDAMEELLEERKAWLSNGRSGFNAPIIITGMGSQSVHCATDEEPAEVETGHSECVLSFDLDHPRSVVREFYGDAAETPQEDLCCPVQPAAEDLEHIPKEVVERFYGCGSPVARAEIRPGETTLDLGSGAGIDVFIAAKKVGPEGKAIGVDMTDQMLAVANENKPIVATNLGYDSVEFRKGFLEEIPAEDSCVDLVTSNCVINLSPDKLRVFAEVWRILKDHGRLVFSDIVSEEEVPLHQRKDPRLWGECISGALTEEELLAYLERTGFYGVQVLQKSFWKEVEGYRFYSVTVRGYKFEKKEGCVFIGQTAIYQGPFKGISDEEGHWFPRNTPVVVCTDTATKLSRAPYTGIFLITDPDSDFEGFACCGADGSECC